jgi:uncharacterized membrane protein YphA (DoxX/SURF4 family)
MAKPGHDLGVKQASLILRLGIAAVFAYAAIAAIVAPDDWVGYIPHYVREQFRADVLLMVFSVFELLLALWLVSGKFARWAGIITALMMGAIIVSDLGLFVITFRDIAIAAAGLALAVLPES